MAAPLAGDSSRVPRLPIQEEFLRTSKSASSSPGAVAPTEDQENVGIRGSQSDSSIATHSPRSPLLERSGIVFSGSRFNKLSPRSPAISFHTHSERVAKPPAEKIHEPSTIESGIAALFFPIWFCIALLSYLFQTRIPDSEIIAIDTHIETFKKPSRTPGDSLPLLQTLCKLLNGAKPTRSFLYFLLLPFRASKAQQEPKKLSKKIMDALRGRLCDLMNANNLLKPNEFACQYFDREKLPRLIEIISSHCKK